VTEDLDPSKLRRLLVSERRQWEEFGVAPSADSVELVVDSFAELDLGQLDQAFLFVALALLLSGEIDDDDNRADLEFALSEIGDILFAGAEAQADSDPMASVLGVATMRLVSASALRHVANTVLHVARLDAGVGPEPTLYALLVNDKRRSVEVIVKPGRCRIAAFTEPSEAVTSLHSWIVSSS